jgi:hypothetical protein
MLRKTGDSGNAGIASQSGMTGVAGEKQYFTKSGHSQTGIGLECLIFLMPGPLPDRMEAERQRKACGQGPAIPQPFRQREAILGGPS